MSTDPNTDPYPNVPTAAVYDTFAETASKLVGRYVRLSDMAPTAEEREMWWQKALAIRAAKHAVPAHDRAQLIAHIQQWDAALAQDDSA